MVCHLGCIKLNTTQGNVKSKELFIIVTSKETGKYLKVMQAGWVQGEDDTWLWAEEKSNMNQEVGAQFFEDIESR